MPDTTEMKHIYQVPMSARLLALYQNLMNLASDIGNEDHQRARLSARMVDHALRVLGRDEFKVAMDQITILADKAKENGELRELDPETTTENPVVALLKAIGFNVTELSTDPECCGHPPEGAETDPLCNHCGLRHP